MKVLILSNGNDTNGQNARYVKAARHLRILAAGNADPAGVVTRFRLAAEKLGGLEIREAHRAQPYMDFPSDIIWTRQTDREVRHLAEDADLIHLNNSDQAYRAMGRAVHGKPALLHHHGSLFRSDMEKAGQDTARSHWFRVAHLHRWVQAVSTIDLTRPDPKELHWLPTAYDVGELEAYGKAHRREPDGCIRIVSAPTNRAYKATEALTAAVASLRAKGVPVELVLVERQSWADCMAIKATADIVFDQVKFGYGCNAVEAWGMGIPVIAGADEWTLTAMRAEFGELPFYTATEESIGKAIGALAASADLRAEWGAKGSAHVRRYHDEAPALARLAELYHKALTYPKTRRAQQQSDTFAVTFRNLGNRKVYDEDGEELVWTDGVATVTDPMLVARLRQYAKRRNFGILEVEPEVAA